MRGEHLCLRLCAVLRTGSSPHARGAQLPGEDEYLTDGIIPACAGSTEVYATRDCINGDHPRMRGEHSITRNPLLYSEGSSPHARGAH